jgi:DNA-binding transcriptional LysR family regulator
MNINFELYKVFYYCAKNLSFSEAANELFVTQSSVSQSIKKLENELAIELFARKGRRITLTTEGEQLYHFIQKAFKSIKAGEKSIDDLKNFEKGEITIGASDTITKYYLMDYLIKFHELYPAIKIKIINNPSPKSIALVNKGAIDFGVININPEDEHHNLLIDNVWTSKNIFVCSKKYKALTTKKVSIKQLNDYPLISLDKNSTTRKIMKIFLDNHDINLDFDFEFGSTSLIIDMTLAGMGIGFLSLDSVKDLLDEKQLFQLSIKENLPSIAIGLIQNKQFPTSLSSEKFINLIKKSEK